MERNEEFKKLKKELGWTARKIADELGVSLFAVESWARSDNPNPMSEPTWRLFLRIVQEQGGKEDGN